eukprot:CAMPEP_0172863746 /NCGR_PEP_ID=MMETSP1075-20121228/78232_1 /TAXON_ID=2916 /ORGANISM="Ceratium fusus, Strain PA161109" /LENGTH=146 /DNA_ID=CAMNT_0013712447 /DNA_START=154 /DNA_END=595 /DNA_ORIENTATION=+
MVQVFFLDGAISFTVDSDSQCVIPFGAPPFVASVLAGSFATTPDIAWSEAATPSKEEEQLEAKLVELKSKIKEKKQAFKEAVKPLQEQIKKEKAAYKQQVAPLQKDVKDLQATLKGLQKDRITKAAPSKGGQDAGKGSSDDGDELD